MKTVVISGANEGIGYHLAEQLLEDRFNVAVLDISIENIRELAKRYPNTLTGFECDVRDEQMVSGCVGAAAAKFGTIDYAIHNACICTFKCFSEIDNNHYQQVMDVNFFGALNLTRAVLPVMEKQGSGKIILASSGVGVMGFVNISPYACSKGAIEAFTKCMNIEYNQKGISFQLYHPPLTRTKSSSPLPVPQEFMADPVKVGRGLAKRINKKGFFICHNAMQSFQTRMMYLIPIAMGRLMSKMTAQQSDSKHNT